MTYLPTLRLFFGAAVYNEYRLRDDRVEFCQNGGEWRTLDDSDMQLHFRLKTLVSKWLRGHSITAEHSQLNHAKRKTPVSDRASSF